MNGSLRENRGAAVLGGGAILLAGAIGLAIATVGPQAAGLAPGIAGAVVLLVKPVLGLLALLFTVPIEATLMIPGGGTLSKALAILVLAAWVANKLLRRESWMSVLGSRVFLSAVVFLAFAMASRLWATYQTGFNSTFLRVVLLFGLGVLAMDLVRTWSQAAWVVKVLVAGGLVAAALTLGQYFGEAGVRRAGGGISGGINATAILLVTLTPFAFSLVRSPEKGAWRVVGLAYLALGVVAVGVTLSRMSFLVLGLLLVVEFWQMLWSRRGRFALVLLLLFGVPAFLHFMPLETLVQRAQTIGPYVQSTLRGDQGGLYELSGRGYHLQVGLAIFRDHPWLGAGFNNYGRSFLTYQFAVPGTGHLFLRPRSPHSTYVGILADLGVVGTGLWLVLLGFAVANLKAAWSGLAARKGSFEFLLVRAVTLAFLVQLSYGFYENVHFDKLWWILLGLTVPLRRLALDSSSWACGTAVSR